MNRIARAAAAATAAALLFTTPAAGHAAPATTPATAAAQQQPSGEQAEWAGDYLCHANPTKLPHLTGARSNHTATEALQVTLAGLGYSPGPLDGRYGPKTKRAVKKFQARHHLAVDGLVGPKTWRAVKNAACGTGTRATTPKGTRAPDADINGDGKPDQIWFRFPETGFLESRYQLWVRVNGRLVTASGTCYDKCYSYLGAGPLDGVRGAEIAIRQVAGAHFVTTQVFTWRRGKLVTEKGPFVGENAWSVMTGLRRTVSGGKVRLHVMYANLTSGDNTFARDDYTYLWTGGKWVEKTRRSSTADRAQVEKAAGWHIKGFGR